MRVFLDHNAGSPVRPEAVAALSRALNRADGNPSSIHRSGQRARQALETARAQVAGLIGAQPREIIFTSGGTESNNLAIESSLRSARARRKVITSAIEHSSILAPLMIFESRGFEVVRVKPDREGRILAREVAGAIDENTALVTLGLVNGEVGTIQDLGDIAEHADRAGAVFHLDAAQAAGRIPLDAIELGCHFMTLSAHKIGAPAGCGALFARNSSAVVPMLLGGPQERGRRAGTENLLGAIAFGAAAEAARLALPIESERVRLLSEELLSGLNARIPGLILNGPSIERVANTLNLTFPDVLGESMLIALDLEGIEVSMGSACAAGSVEPSHVLIAMDRTAAQARSSLRLSLGWSTTPEEIAAAAEIIPRIWRRVADAEPAAVRGAL